MNGTSQRLALTWLSMGVAFLISGCDLPVGEQDGTNQVPPSAPSDLAALGTAPTQVELSWTDTSAVETGFQIQRRSGSGVYDEIASVAADSTDYQDTGLNAETQYTYRVRAVNGVGESAWSEEASVQTPRPAEVTVSPLNGLRTSEVGGSDTFSVVLDTQPSADVTVPIASSNVNEGTVDPPSLTFTGSDWSTPQTVTVTGVNDSVVDGSVGYTIQLGPAESSDPHYEGRDPADVSVTNADNDPAGVSVSRTAGLVTSESGDADSFSVVLDSPTSADVVLALASSNTGEGSVSPSSLTFTPEQWDVAQSVTVTGVDDGATDDGNTAYDVVIDAAITVDPDYNGIDPPDVSATNWDDETTPFTETFSAGSGSALLGFRSFDSRSVGQGQSVTYSNDHTVTSFEVSFANAFSKIIGSNSDPEAAPLRLEIWDTGDGRLLGSAEITVPSSFSGGPVSFDLSAQSVRVPANTTVLYALYIADAASNELNNGVVFDPDSGYTGGTRWTAIEPATLDLDSFSYWSQLGGDLPFDLAGEE